MKSKLFDRVRDLLGKASHEAGEMSEALMVLEPVPPYGGKGVVTVLITAASLISIALLGGVGLMALAILFVALGIIFLILSSVFGISFDLDPAELFRAGANPWH
jgi:hypothetical protein